MLQNHIPQQDVSRHPLSVNQVTNTTRYRLTSRRVITSLCMIGSLWATAGNCLGQAISDDFDDGDANGWVAHEVVYDGSREVIDGAYQLTTDDPVSVGEVGHVISRFDSESPIGDGFLRAKVKANTLGTSAGIAFMTDSDPPNFYVFNGETVFGNFNLSRSNGRTWLPTVPDSDVIGSITSLPRFNTGDAWWLELGVLDGLVSVKAWQDGSEIPDSPHFTVLDRNPHPVVDISVAAWISTGWRSPVHVDASFDDILFTPWVEFDCNVDGVVSIADANCSSPQDLEATLNAASLLPGDLDASGSVDFQDFLTISQNFGNAGVYTEGDLDLNGTIEFSDFLILSENFGKNAADLAAVPEPTGIAWWLVSLLAMFVRCQPLSR